MAKKPTKTKAPANAGGEAQAGVSEYLAEVDKLTAACRAYYGDGTSPMSDEEYDQRLKALLQLELQHPDWAVSYSPTRRIIGGETSGFQKVKHLSPMLSLDNMFDDADLARFLAGIPDNEQVLIEPKVDGLSIELRYQDGVFVQALTRGDGIEGEDVTAQARTIRNLPLALTGRPAGLVRLRGEVYMSFADFARVNEDLRSQGHDPLANPRNAAAGALKSLDLAVVSSRRLSVVCYEVLDHGEMSDTWKILTIFEVPHLQRYGFMVPSLPSVVGPLLQTLNVARSWYPFATDGAVVKAVSAPLREYLGHNGKAPRWAAAFKFPPEEVQTTLVGVTTQVGRHGTLTPVANVSPVQLGGCVVRNASLCNWDEIARLDVRIGDTVVVVKAGEIIPKIVRVRADLRKGHERVIPVPTVCACCGSPVKPDKEDAVALRCSGGYACPETRMRRLEHAVSKDALDIDGMGPGTLVKLTLDGTQIPTLAEIFSLTEDAYREAGFSELQAAKLVKATQAAVHRGDQSRLLYALSIPNVGRTASRALINCFGGLRPAMEASASDITACPDLLPIAAQAFIEWVETSEAFETLRSLEDAGFVTTATPKAIAGDTLKGQTWVITGTLSADREVFEDMIRAHGGKVGSGVSKNTSALLVGDKAGSKLDKANKLGVKVWNEKAFRQLIGA